VKLAAWNTRRAAHSVAEAHLAQFVPDVSVLSEVQAPIEPDPGCVNWRGANGLGMSVAVSNSLQLEPIATTLSMPRYAGLFRVSGKDVSFAVLAIWPVRAAKERTVVYHRILMEALAASESELRNGRCIVAGDLNTNSSVTGLSKTHHEFVRAAADLGLVSAYHHLSGHEHGREPEPTYTRAKTDEHGWHLDFCFAPKRWLAGATVSIGPRDPWRSRSDHLPLFVEIPDRHFKE
jgi:endonuclease/exonuclease/phosphatase family metal-dependent hydrolase